MYHRLCYSLHQQWQAVPCRDLVKDRAALSRVCDFLSIPDLPGKERYWEDRQHHVVGGNPSARVHLYSVESVDYHENVRRSSSAIDLDHGGNHRSIFYSTRDDSLARQQVQRCIEASSQLQLILQLLESRDVRKHRDTVVNSNDLAKQLTIPEPLISARRVNNQVKQTAARLRYYLEPSSV
jgi:hypothetical protein